MRLSGRRRHCSRIDSLAVATTGPRPVPQTKGWRQPSRVSRSEKHRLPGRSTSFANRNTPVTRSAHCWNRLVRTDVAPVHTDAQVRSSLKGPVVAMLRSCSRSTQIRTPREHRDQRDVLRSADGRCRPPSDRHRRDGAGHRSPRADGRRLRRQARRPGRRAHRLARHAPRRGPHSARERARVSPRRPPRRRSPASSAPRSPASSARPTCCRATSSAPRSTTRRTASSTRASGRSTPTSSSSTRSTGRAPRPRAPRWRRCRNARRASAA